MAPTSVDIVIPVLNEERALPGCVRTLSDFLTEGMPAADWRIIIADNGSTDATPEVGRRLAEDSSRVGYLRLEERGRGRALKMAWRNSSAAVVAYMDVDLSTNLAALPALVGAVAGGESAVAIGSRLRPGSRVYRRTIKREITSRVYNFLVRLLFFATFRDAQCGFKAVSRQFADQVVPLVQDNGWFFDTEMLLVAEGAGYRVKEVPVTWVDDPDTRVRVVSTSWGQFKGLLRMRFGGLRRAVRSLA